MYMLPAACGMPGFGAAESTPHTLPSWVAPVAIVSLVGLVGVAMYYKFKTTQSIIESHGVGSALAFEAGETGLEMIARSAARKNGRRSRSRRRG